MAFRVRCQVFVDVLPSGTGQMAAMQSPLQGPFGGGGFAQTISFVNTQGGYISAGAGTSPTTGALVSSDVTTLLNSLRSDMSSQIGAQLSRINNFLIGQG